MVQPIHSKKDKYEKIMMTTMKKDENDPPSLIAPVKDIESCADIAQI